MCNMSAKCVIQCKLHIKILDYDWLNNRIWSGPMKSFCLQIKRAPWMAQLKKIRQIDVLIATRYTNIKRLQCHLLSRSQAILLKSFTGYFMKGVLLMC